MDKEQEKVTSIEKLECIDTNDPEKALVQLLSEREPNAFRMLYGNYSANLLSFIKRIVNDEEVSKDLCQDVFLRIWLNFKQYDASKGRLFTWMLKIARNICLDHLKSRRHRFALTLLPLEDHIRAAERTYSDMEKICLNDLLFGLQPIHLEVVEMIYIHGFTQDEVARIKSIPVGTVKTRNRTALRNLRTKFKIRCSEG